MCLLRYVYDVWAQSRLFGENLCQVVESTSHKKSFSFIIMRKRLNQVGQ